MATNLTRPNDKLSFDTVEDERLSRSLIVFI
jgi:hypothetical protein